MPQFLTRQSFFQQQPQVAQLPFSQFGGNRPPLQGDTTGGIAFPDAGQPGQPQPQPNQSPLSPFLLPTGLSGDEMNALLGNQFSGNRNIDQLRLRSFDGFGNFQVPQLSPSLSPSTSTTPAGGISFEGGSVDKFNPTLNTGTPLPTTTGTTTATSPLNRNLLGGF